MFDACQWECDWIMNHPDGYDGPMHQKAVCENIKKRYFMARTKQLVEAFAKTKTTGSQLELFEHFGEYQ